MYIYHWRFLSNAVKKMVAVCSGNHIFTFENHCKYKRTYLKDFTRLDQSDLFTGRINFGTINPGNP